MNIGQMLCVGLRYFPQLLFNLHPRLALVARHAHGKLADAVFHGVPRLAHARAERPFRAQQHMPRLLAFPARGRQDLGRLHPLPLQRLGQMR
jgi:hypothetical protein